MVVEVPREKNDVSREVITIENETSIAGIDHFVDILREQKYRVFKSTQDNYVEVASSGMAYFSFKDELETIWHLAESLGSRDFFILDHSFTKSEKTILRFLF